MPAATDSLTATLNSVAYTTVNQASINHNQANLSYLTGGSSLNQQNVGGEKSNDATLTFPAEDADLADLQAIHALVDGTAKTWYIKNNSGGPSASHPELQGSAVPTSISVNLTVGQLPNFTVAATYSGSVSWAES